MTETYTISVDFSNGVDPGLLHQEIDANGTITTTLLAVESIDDSCNIIFVSTISGAEKTALDALVAAHDPLPTNSTVIVVAKDGNGDYTSIASALTDANTRAGNGIRCVVIVHPGIYIESNPMTVGTGVTIRGYGSWVQTTVVPTNANTHVMEIHTRGLIEGLAFYGAAGPSGVAIKYDGTGGSANNSLALVRECGVQYCTTGILAVNGSSTNKNSLTIQTVGMKSNPSQGITTGVQVNADAEVFLVNLRTFSNDTTPITNAVSVTGASAHCLVTDAIIDRGTNGIIINDSAAVEIRSTHIRNTTGSAIKITGTGTKTEITTSKLESDLYDVDIQATSITNLSLVGSYISINKINNPNDVYVSGVMYDDNVEDRGLHVLGELKVGTASHPSEACIGGGDSYVQGMIILNNDDLAVGTWVDNTTDAKSSSGSTFTLFPDLLVDSCAYIGSDWTFYGFKVVMGGTTMASGEYDHVVLEYYDGSSWTAVNCMWTHADAPYSSHAKNHFQEASTTMQVRFDGHMVWNSKLSLNGESKYWVRFRITTAITNNPVIEKFAIHSSRMEINADGFVEYFGNGRPVKVFPWSMESIYGIPTGLFSLPNDADLYISDNIAIAGVKNEFPNGVTRAVAYTGFVPHDMDTSSGIRMKLAFMAPDTNTGNVRWRVRWGYSNGDTWKVYTSTASAPTAAPIEFDAAMAVAVSGVAYKVSYVDMTLDVSDLVSNPDTSEVTPTIGWMVLSREGGHGDDTYGSAVYIVNFQSTYIEWSNGAHISTIR